MIRTIKNMGFAVCTGIASVLIVLAILFPDLYGCIVPYRFYHVLTNSMEPEIGANSLVVVKSYDDSMIIEKNAIITFYAERFGEQIIITHRFSHAEENVDGEVVYRTHPEQTELLDPYETRQEDILGVYLFHIPYAGKLILFLKSRFGFLWGCQIVLILLIRKIVITRWKKEEKELLQNG